MSAGKFAFLWLPKLSLGLPHYKLKNCSPYMYRMWYTVSVGKKPKSSTGIGTPPEALERQGKRVPAIFYCTEAGGEPVREWLRGLSPEDRKRIGEDVKTVEFGWPIGMPVCKPLGDGIYEVRTTLAQNRICTDAFLHRQEGPDGLAPWIHQENAEDTGRGFGPGAPQQE